MPRFTLDDARGICLTPFLEREMRIEATRRADDAAEARRTRGVAWSGLARSPAAGRTPAQVRHDAAAAHAEALAFAASPRGRFLSSLARLEQQGCMKETAAARAAYARGLADPERPASPAEIGAALSALAPLASPGSREACLALAELLTAALGVAA